MTDRARDFTVRAATLEDAAGIARVQVETWRTAYTGLVPDEYLAQMGGARRVARWRQNLSGQGDRTRSFVAERDDDIIGFAGVGPARGDFAPEDHELLALYVLASEQRRGAGRALLAACARFVIERGGSAMFAWALREGPGRHFYAGVGGEQRGVSEIEIGGEKLSEDGWVFSPVSRWLAPDDATVMDAMYAHLDELLRRTAFFSEAHSVKAALAWARLRLRFAAVRDAVGEEALAWNQVLEAPAAAGLLSRDVAWPAEQLSERRVHGAVDGAVFPLAYVAAVEHVRRWGARDLVERQRTRALARMGEMGHAYTIHRSFEEVLPYLTTDEQRALLAERVAELVATQLARTEHTPAESPAVRLAHDDGEVVTRTLKEPGYFGHTLITLGTLLRFRHRLGEAGHKEALGRVAAMLDGYGPVARAVTVPAPDAASTAGEAELAAAVEELLTGGPKEAHTLTLADGACAVFDFATPPQRAHVVAVLRAFASWDPNRTASGERAADATG